MISKYSSKPAIVSLFNPHTQDYVPKHTPPNFPKPLPSLYQPYYAGLLSESVEAHDKLVLTTEMVEAVGKERHNHSHSILLYRCCAEIVTASKMKAGCRMNSDRPPQLGASPDGIV